MDKRASPYQRKSESRKFKRLDENFHKIEAEGQPKPLVGTQTPKVNITSSPKSSGGSKEKTHSDECE